MKPIPSHTYSNLDTPTKAAFQAVLRAAVKLADMGFLAGVGGNIALRLQGEKMVVTPSGLDYYAMQAQDLCLLDIRTLKPLYALKTPSIESGLHAAILRKRPDCNVSIHTHQSIASAFSLAGTNLIPQTKRERDILGSVIPISDYALSGTKWLTNKVAARVTPVSNAYLMRNHGVVCLGSNFAQAIEVTKVLEQACADWFSQQMGDVNMPMPMRPYRQRILSQLASLPL